jgi:hypothetical protein
MYEDAYCFCKQQCHKLVVLLALFLMVGSGVGYSQSFSVAGECQSNRVTLQFYHTNDVYYHVLCSDSILDADWQVAGLDVGDSEPVMWSQGGYTNKNGLFFRVLSIPRVNAVDLDEDGIDDYYELVTAFLSPTNSADAGADHDLDGVSNGQEYSRGTDPDDTNDVNIVLYVNSATGSDELYDGLSPTVSGEHGPLGSIGAGVGAAIDEDSVDIAAGTYLETGLSGNKRLVLVPRGTVRVESP